VVTAVVKRYREEKDKFKTRLVKCKLRTAAQCLSRLLTSQRQGVHGLPSATHDNRNQWDAKSQPLSCKSDILPIDLPRNLKHEITEFSYRHCLLYVFCRFISNVNDENIHSTDGMSPVLGVFNTVLVIYASTMWSPYFLMGIRLRVRKFRTTDSNSSPKIILRLQDVMCHTDCVLKDHLRENLNFSNKRCTIVYKQNVNRDLD